MIRDFTAKDVPDQSGKTFFITGANTGIGLETAKVLAGRGARVLLGCRSRSKAEQAASEIAAAHSWKTDVDIVDLDLGDLSSIRAAAEVVRGEERLDGLINNAGVMVPPRELTKDGFESQLGINHLGPFALTGLLLDKLEETDDARVIITSSNAHKRAKFDFDDLNAERSYSRIGRYAMSKLANLLHMYELDRRLRARGSSTLAVAVHPGVSNTDLPRHMGPFKVLVPLLGPVLNTPAQAAWPTLLGATAPGVASGQYFGPSGFGEFSGPAKQVDSTRRSKDPQDAKRLWKESIRLTGVDPELPPA